MPSSSVILHTVLSCLFDFMVLFGIPYALVTIPQTSLVLAQAGISADPGFLLDLGLFALIVIALTVARNFSSPSSFIHLAAGLALIGSGIVVFLLMGSYNASTVRFGLTTFFLNVGGSVFTITAEYVTLAIVWLLVGGLKATSLTLAFIEARRTKASLRLPQPPQLMPAPALARSVGSQGLIHKYLPE